jgi:hypothetical protein
MRRTAEARKYRFHGPISSFPELAAAAHRPSATVRQADSGRHQKSYMILDRSRARQRQAAFALTGPFQHFDPKAAPAIAGRPTTRT